MATIEEFVDLPDQLLTIDELARFLNTTRRHIRRLVYENRIPYLKVGRFIRFDPLEIRRWLRSNHHGTTDDGRP